jgi:hypothetical protein
MVFDDRTIGKPRADRFWSIERGHSTIRLARDLTR